MKPTLTLLTALLLAPLAALSAFAGEAPSAAPVVPKDINAYCLDFNWGPGGPNSFAKPGLWADADPAQHVENVLAFSVAGHHHGHARRTGGGAGPRRRLAIACRRLGIA